MIIGMVPVRISFAGGGSDMPEYYEKYGGSVISTNISQFTYLIVNPTYDKTFQAFSSDFGSHHQKSGFSKLELIHGTEIPISTMKFFKYKKGGDFLICSDVPPGSGLGASSTLAVNCVNTISKLQGKKLSKEKIAETAFYIERTMLKHPIGKQDDYIASFGGFNHIKFSANKIKVTPIKFSKSTKEEFEQSLLLFYMGTTRNSSIILSKQLKNIKSNNQKTINSVHHVREIVDDLYSSLKQSDIRNVGELLNKGWEEKKKFVKGITNSHIDDVYTSAIRAGAIGGKLTGAGGGGHLLLYCEKSKQAKVIKKMNGLGLRYIPFTFDELGPKILNLSKLR
jgi:D-glycero-alpha-D-manno-heptose-7-phosphate kinase